MDEHGNPFHYENSQRIFARLDRTTARDAEREPRHVTLVPKVEETRTLFDVVDPAAVVATLRESLTACLTTAAARDGVELSAEQIERFVREMANNSSMAVLLMEIKHRCAVAAQTVCSLELK